MDQPLDDRKPARLIVFSDDWGRHPSSCQHLTRRLLERNPALWVNTIGTRRPGLSREDLAKIVAKLRQWIRPTRAEPAQALPPDLQVVSPPMYPGFRAGWQRRLNARLIARAVHRALGPRRPDQKRIVVTTLPITADLPGRLDVDRWVYYCVDDFSVWPGLDAQVMQAMEQQLVTRVDAVIAVSETLRQRMAGFGADNVALLTHGIDLSHWQSPPAGDAPEPFASQSAALSRPLCLFWGVIDTRLDLDWCRAIGAAGSLVLIGPQQSPDDRLAALPGVHLLDPAAYDDLPAIAALADILVMPYADLPVTRAMQPLKFKEYLATGKPVIARNLPAVTEWSNAADLRDTTGDLASLIAARAADGIPPDQQQARRRLQHEDWNEKARTFERILLAD